ncbi:hypothetical protein QJS10_CPB15g00206 [Acorus calamus]|uniref:Uncharacterized protein n=1 Tax=Acorus calamus TaxID=4465 RepID=A0AAV9DA70_ACOCL|nr:hypothetical protein QJS10_CPB15g00206 [Acorus calamus]
MGFWTLLEVSTMPILQVLIVGLVGAFMATQYFNVLPSDARKHMNKVVFIAFTPSLMFASLAKTVTLHDIISWWFMPVNIGLTFLFGGILGWVVVKILKPEKYLEGLVIASCSAGNLGNLLIIIIPAICHEDGSPFGDSSICSVHALSYASFSMALGGFFIWTYTYSLIRNDGITYDQFRGVDRSVSKTAPNANLDAGMKAPLLKGDEGDEEALPLSTNTQLSEKKGSWTKFSETIMRVVEELLAPPTVAAIIGFIFGATPWLKSLIIGATAPLRVIQESITLLGDGTIPCITLILGGNLVQGLRKSRLRATVMLSIICVRYVILPAIGVAVVMAAAKLGLLPSDPLYHYVLMIQFTLPPAMNIGTMTQLFDVGQEECSVIFLWTYVVSAFAITIWSTVYMWILS